MFRQSTGTLMKNSGPFLFQMTMGLLIVHAPMGLAAVDSSSGSDWAEVREDADQRQ